MYGNQDLQHNITKLSQLIYMTDLIRNKTGLIRNETLVLGLQNKIPVHTAQAFILK